MAKLPLGDKIEQEVRGDLGNRVKATVQVLKHSAKKSKTTISVLSSA